MIKSESSRRPYTAISPRIRRAVLLFVFVAAVLPRITDAAIDVALGLIGLIGSMVKRAERRCLDARVENRRGIGDIVRIHADLAARWSTAALRGGTWPPSRKLSAERIWPDLPRRRDHIQLRTVSRGA